MSQELELARLKAQMEALKKEIRIAKGELTKQEQLDNLLPIFDAIDTCALPDNKSLRISFKDGLVDRSNFRFYNTSALNLSGGGGGNGGGRQIEIDMNRLESEEEYLVDGYEGDWRLFKSGAAACQELGITVAGANAHLKLQSKLRFSSVRIRAVSTAAILSPEVA